MTQIKFITSCATYEADVDTLCVVVEREEATEELFTITVDFMNQRHDIASHHPEHDTEVDYAPRVMLAFMSAFKTEYAALDHTASPYDVFDKQFLRFTVVCE